MEPGRVARVRQVVVAARDLEGAVATVASTLATFVTFRHVPNVTVTLFSQAHENSQHLWARHSLM
jgi:hypothetical protein